MINYKLKLEKKRILYSQIKDFILKEKANRVNTKNKFYKKIEKYTIRTMQQLCIKALKYLNISVSYFANYFFVL